jgi:hypothetical protein
LSQISSCILPFDSMRRYVTELFARAQRQGLRVTDIRGFFK